MRYAIGLDIGITSVGWAVVNLDKNRIEAMNVRMFDAAENPKDGSSLATPRREARSSRRTIRRRRHRVSRVRHFFIEKGLLSQVEAEQLFDWKDGDLDVWMLRVNGLERQLSEREFARILLHYAKNRGFKSNRKSETKPGEEGGVLLQAVEANKALMDEKGYETVAQMLTLEVKHFDGRKRNKGGAYTHVLARSEIEEEIRLVFERQREFGNTFATEENEESFLKIWASQRPYSKQEDIIKKIGDCTFEKGEKRAPKFSYSFERFRALDKLNRLRIISKDNPARPLTEDERMEAFELLTEKEEVKYSHLRKTLQIDSSERFNELYYDPSKTNAQNENRVFLALKGTYQMREAVKKALGKEALASYGPKDYDTFAYAVTVYKDDTDARAYLQNTYVSEKGKKVRNLQNKVYEDALIEELLYLDYSQFGHLSLKALRNILPFVEQGMQYHAACEAAGYHFNERVGIEKQRLLPVIPADKIMNPVVIRSLSQTRKIINGIIKRYGSPSGMYIELARDMGRPYKERRDIEKLFNKNRTVNDQARDHILELHPEFGNPRGHDILKYKLWREQNEKCAYSRKPITVERLFSPGYAEVDHIIPYSRSFDDSNNNKVLVLAPENQNKQNRTPYEWFGSDTKRWGDFSTYVKGLNVSTKKKNLLLKTNFDAEAEEEFKSRHLNDTRYITRFLMNFVEDNLLFREEEGKKQYVYSVNGAYTALMRKRWGFNKNRAENDLHHAIDAAIVAVSHPFRHQVSNYFKQREVHVAELFKRQGGYFPEPWEGFRRELEARMIQDPDKLKLGLESLAFDSYDDEFIQEVKPIFVSRMPKRTVKGQIHAETVRRHRGYNERGLMRVVTKTKLENIPFDKKTGDFPMYGKESDPGTYHAIKERYLEFGGDVKKAFLEPLYKPARNSENAPVIRGVKIEDTTNRAMPLGNGAVAANASIVRTEVYRHKETGKFYLAPVYVSDVLAGRLPEKFITAHKAYESWVDITDDYEFQFNLYPNDVINIKMPRKKKSKTNTGETVEWTDGMFYFVSPHTATAQINIIDHKNSFKDAIGSQGLKQFEKYQVDPLGNFYKVHKEKRHEL